MKIDFLEIQISCFKSFDKGPHILNLTEFDPGLHFVRGDNQVEPRLGSNGAGKSTVWDALCWCLAGKTPDNLKNPDIKPWHHKGQTDVTVFIDVDGSEYSITRTTNPNSLLINDETAGQDDIEKLIGLSFDVFTHTVLMGQSQPLFFDLAPRAKMDLFVEVLDLHKWDRRSASASSKLLRLNEKLSNSEITISGIEGSLEEVESLYKEARDKSSDWEASRQEKLQNLKANLDIKEQKEKDLNNKLNEARVQADGAGVELKAIQNDSKKISAQLSAASQTRHEHTIKLELVEKDVARLQDELKKLGRGNKCPTCGQSIKGTELDKHKNNLMDDLDAQKEKLAKGIPKNIVKKVDELNEKLTELSKQEVQFQTKLEQHEAEVIEYTPRVSDLKSQVSTLKTQIDEWEDETNPHSTSLTKLRRRKSKLNSDLRAAEEGLQKIERAMERTKFWVKGFKDIRLYIIEDVLQQLELTTNAVLEEVGLLNWQVEYLIEKETKSGSVQRGLSVVIKQPNNTRGVKWESWSGGEGQRLRIVGALALSEVLFNYAGIQTNLEILDEPTQHLSEEGVRDLCDFLADRAQQVDRQTWYVDHQSIESTRFSSVMTVVKTNNGTQIQFDN